MIEIEKKFLLTEEQKTALLKNATFLGEKIQTDTYYDTADIALTCKDIWLRNRNGRFEIKIPLHALGDKLALTHYRELETDEEICAFLHLSSCVLTNTVLADAGYLPFATIITTRKRYQDEPYFIDLDSCDFGDGNLYCVTEIETNTEENDREKASQALMDYALRKGLSHSYVRGKLIEYLLRHAPTHYQALVDAGVFYVSPVR